MAKKKKKLLVLLSVVMLLGGWWYYSHFYTGSRSGKVVDAVTGKPIEGAVVCMQWSGGGFMGIVASRCTALYETKSDGDGRYHIPSQRLEDGSGKEAVMVYKDGYSAYEVSGTDYKQAGRSFASGTEKQPYHKKRNLVQLHRFKQSDSHREHLRWIHTFGVFGWPEQLLEKELQKEMERARQER